MGNNEVSIESSILRVGANGGAMPDANTGVRGSSLCEETRSSTGLRRLEVGVEPDDSGCRRGERVRLQELPLVGGKRRGWRGEDGRLAGPPDVVETSLGPL